MQFSHFLTLLLRLYSSSWPSIRTAPPSPVTHRYLAVF